MIFKDYDYSASSAKKLATCHQDLITIFHHVLKYFDHTIIEGYRREEDQNKAFAEGKSKLKWPQGKHNRNPSMAVDAIPYPIDWRDRERMTLFAGFVLGVARMMKENGIITHNVRWGGDWDRDTEVKDNRFDDLVHFELAP